MKIIQTLYSNLWLHALSTNSEKNNFIHFEASQCSIVRCENGKTILGSFEMVYTVYTKLNPSDSSNVAL